MYISSWGKLTNQKTESLNKPGISFRHLLLQSISIQLSNYIYINTKTTIKAPLEKVWNALFTNFGKSARFNPNVISSQLTNTLEEGVTGHERECRLSKKTYVKEKITRLDKLKNFTWNVTGGNMPLVKYMQVDILMYESGLGITTVTAAARIATKPGFLGYLMKGIFKANITDMLIGLKYHLETRMIVTKENYNLIFQNYQLLHSNESFLDIPSSYDKHCSDCSICCNCQK